MKKVVYVGLVLALVGLTIGGFSLVSAQKGYFGGHGFGPSSRGGMHGGGMLGHSLTEGTSLEAVFYNGDPAEEAEVVNTLSFVAGEHSARNFMKEFRVAAKDAEFVVVNKSAQSRSVDLSKVKEDGQSGRSKMHRLTFLLFHLNEGSNFEATFYDGNPDEGGSELNSLNFVAGEDSELAFRNDFAESAKDSAYVVLSTSPQTRTVNLSAMKERFGSREEGGRWGDGSKGPKGPNNFSGPRFWH